MIRLKVPNVHRWIILGSSVSALLLGFVFIAIPAHREVRRSQNMVNCRQQIYANALSVQDYQYSEDRFRSHTKQPFYGNKETGEEYWSWRVSFLSHFEPYHSKNQFRFDEPWNSEYNFPLLKETDVARHFTCPCEYPKDKRASYVAVKGPGTFWTEMQNGNLPGEFYDYKDTIIIIETSEPKNFWAEPGDDVSPEDVVRLYNTDPGLVKNSQNSSESGYSHWPKHFVTAIGDVKGFDTIKNVEELKKRLVISQEMIEHVKVEVQLRNEKDIYLND